MILRVIYKIWIYFWRTFFTLAGIFLLSTAIIVGVLQLPQSKDFIKEEITELFSSQFEGTLQIEKISGFLPFSTTLHNGSFYAPDKPDIPVLSFESMGVEITWWNLFQRNFTISSFEVNSPSLKLSMADDESLSIVLLFRQKRTVMADTLTHSERDGYLERINIFAPIIKVNNGFIDVDESIELPEAAQLPEAFTVENLNFSIFLELSDSQIFFDLPDFIAEIPDSEYQFLQVNGQFYSDNEYFELNRFRIGTALGNADFSFEATPVNIFATDLQDQFRLAEYRVQITESSLTPNLIRKLTGAFPPFDDNLEIELTSEGSLETYFIDRFRANIGQSSILISAEIKNMFSSDVSYVSSLDNMVIHPTKLDWISKNYLNGNVDLDIYQLSTVRGSLNGNLMELNSSVRAETEAGAFSLDGSIIFEELLNYDLIFGVDALDITPFLTDTLDSSVIQGRFTLQGKGTGSNADFYSSVDLSNSRIFGYGINSLNAEFNFADNVLRYILQGGDDNELYVTASGIYNRENDRVRFTSDGEVNKLNLKKFNSEYFASHTDFNSTFSANLNWTDVDDLTGRISLEMDESRIGDELLRPHQFYADLNDSDDGNRRLRFTSSFFDGEVNGTLNYSTIEKGAEFWTRYLNYRVDSEIMFSETADSMSFETLLTDLKYQDLYADLSISMDIKDVSLLRKYLPELPEFESSARFNSTINATYDRLLITATLFDERVRYGDLAADNLNSAFTANFRSNRKLRDSSTLDLQVSSTYSSFLGQELKDSFANLSVRDDSLHIRSNLQKLEDDIQLQTTLTGYLKEDRFEILVDDFKLGSPEYQWAQEGRPLISYNRLNALEINNLVFTSGTEYLKIDGTYSRNVDDIVNYTIVDMDLSILSEIIGGRIQFSGKLNGDFSTRTLLDIPAIQGDLTVNDGRIQNRLVGDVSINSLYNSELRQFDTEIHVFTDPEKYSTYYERNDGIGQDLLLTGFFKLPDDANESTDDLFYFDADLREIDMWIVSFIVPNIITEMQGSASGSGFIRGSENDFDFAANFMVDDVYGVPVFTNVGYTINGELDFNLDEGLLFRNIRLRDHRGGTGTLSGQVNLDRFSPLTILDLTLDLNNLQFMNNRYDPDIPFYGQIYGTGQAQISGTNFEPLLRTTRPLSLSSDSRITIPLEPETVFDQDRRFIEFVDSFDIPFWENHFSRIARVENGNGEPEELTFLQLFTMDLQFQALNPIEVQLIFDRVTNDMLSANGTGQMRILLEDQDVSMFGRFNISGGEYQFVSGDIFTRRFTLQEGGSISWSGDLVDAALNVTAAYRARPNVSTLLSGAGSASLVDPNLRIPIDLVLQIGGTITSIENEFFFRIPTGIESSADPTIASQINTLNQNEDEKLIQATSILLTGNFIPSQQAQGLGLAENISGTAVVNPLITSQLINPLLSNQINSLLRSDVTFDIDFNLTTANEIDLGVALRLFDNRIVLRREGQITGEQSDIGDLGATYRINRAFSVTAFHRQDPTLSYTSGIETSQSQEMNGIGFEAQVQFNTWQNLRTRISTAFRSLLGIKQDEQDVEEDRESIADL